MEEKLPQKEQALFEAISQKKSRLVKNIVFEEEALISQGVSPNIRYNAQDDKGNTFCHVAAVTGVKDIISVVLNSEINFAHDIPNNEGKLPEALSWNGIFTKLLPQRKERDEDEKISFQYQQLTEGIKQQETLIGGYKKGIIFTSDFTLTYNSKKNPEKNCIISDHASELDDFSIHDRQALDEALQVNRKYFKEKGWIETPVSFGSNYLLVNIGFVMSIEKYQKQAQIKRRLYTGPLYLPEEAGTNLTIVHREKTSGHSEINLYDLLLYSDNLAPILNYFRKLWGIPFDETRKIYACIIDTHSSQDMCDQCELNTYPFEQQFAALISNIAPTVGFTVGKSFHTVVRASSSRAPTYSGFRKKHYDRQGTNPPIYQDYIARTYTHLQPMDVKKSEPFILHYDSVTRHERGAKWYQKAQIFNSTIGQIPPRSLFFAIKEHRPYHNPFFPDCYEIKNDEDFLKIFKKK